MLHITSRQNDLFKQLKRLLQSGPERTEHPEWGPVAISVLEGVHLCQDWLRHCGQPEKAVFDSKRLQESPELQTLFAALESHCVVTMDATLLASLSPVAKGQGVVFLVHRRIPEMPPHIDRSSIWLDRIQDPGNVGTLLRTAAASGIQHAYLSPECAGAWSPRVLRSAQGAHFAMTIYEQIDLRRARERLQIPLYATALASTAVSLYEAPLSTPCVWVFGNEGQGVAPDLLETADLCVYIPQAAAVESLNVGVAAGVCLFEQRRRHLKGS